MTEDQPELRILAPQKNNLFRPQTWSPTARRVCLSPPRPDLLLLEEPHRVRVVVREELALAEQIAVRVRRHAAGAVELGLFFRVSSDIFQSKQHVKFFPPPFFSGGAFGIRLVWLSFTKKVQLQ